MTEPHATDAMEHLGKLSRDTLHDRMGFECTHASAERVEGRMPVEGNRQPLGLWHGGASAVLAETLGSIGASVHAAPDRIALGIELSCSHHRSAKEGHVHGVATATSLTRSLATYDIEITDDEGRLMCSARLTCMLKDRSARS